MSDQQNHELYVNKNVEADEPVSVTSDVSDKPNNDVESNRESRGSSRPNKLALSRRSSTQQPRKENKENNNVEETYKIIRRNAGSIVRKAHTPSDDVEDLCTYGTESCSQEEEDNSNKQAALFDDEPSSAIKYYFGDLLRSKSLDAWSNIDRSSPPIITSDVTSDDSSCDEALSPMSDASVSDLRFRYSTSYPERGCFLIFNQENFDPALELSRRNGTEKDAARLKFAAEFLGFEYVKIVNDARKLDILNIMDSVANADHSSYECFACAIFTHGGDKDVLYAKDQAFHLKEITRAVTADQCPSLAGKPKLFFVQACRGVKFDEGAQRRRTDSTSNHAVDGPVPFYSPRRSIRENTCIVPVEADFLIAQSTVADYYSWRSIVNGSIFIQTLCACILMYGESMEIMQILTRVNRMVAYDFESSTEDPSMSQKKQIPSITSRLTAELYFPKKKSQ